MQPLPHKQSVMVMAGEASGDKHGAKFVQALKAINPDLFFFGMGGNAMQEAGVKIDIDSESMSVVGITEVFEKAPLILKARSLIIKLLDQWKPKLVVLIDFPDFNLHVAGLAKKRGIKVLYYISPQIWAWRSGRVKKIARRVDHMAVILPFEVSFYKKNGVPVTFVGHPLLDQQTPKLPLPPKIDNSNPPTVGLLPGSRKGEIGMHLPIMLAACRLIQKEMEPVRFLLSVSHNADKTFFHEILSANGWEGGMELVYGEVDTIFQQAHMAIAVSGTVTLETAIRGLPLMIIYRVSPLSYRLGKALIKVPHIGLVNLIAGRTVAPEVIQNSVTPENLAEKTVSMLQNQTLLNKMRQQLLNVRKRLGKPGASMQVAKIAQQLLR